LNGFGSPVDTAARQRARLNDSLALVGRLHRAGIPIVAGTDQSVPGHSLHREIELYVQAVMSPFDALSAATVVPARVMKKLADSGTIEKTRRPDRPRRQPARRRPHTRRVHRVVTNGRVFDPASLWRGVGFQP
jgi:imidazolonepropionase-like amidohydrolase